MFFVLESGGHYTVARVAMTDLRVVSHAKTEIKVNIDFQHENVKVAFAVRL